MRDMPLGWRSSGRRAPTLFCTSETGFKDTGSTLTVSPGGSSQEEELVVISPLIMGGEPAIPVSPLELPLEVPKKVERKKRAVAWATPKSLHDTKIITPATHPNRMGQFAVRKKIRDYTSPLGSLFCTNNFSATVGCKVQVALIQGVKTAGWLDAEILVCNNDATYDISVLPSPLADEHNLSHLTGHAIHHTYLRRLSEVETSSDLLEADGDFIDIDLSS
eukprot:TRINITY_DN3992_c0_g1_i1.p1 TRINITY_DN3992_c0_g1~~TRINITY_DN3992_c0_g1_i1.p1  ORF type:complete len:238 (+),score=39.84 TRINITY_DN3992_c0_g1_i1:57-716(+)